MSFSAEVQVQTGNGSFQRFDECPTRLEVRTGQSNCLATLERQLYSGDAIDLGDGKLATADQLFFRRGCWEVAGERFPNAPCVQVENLPVFSLRNCGHFVLSGGLIAADSQD